ncbi:MAG: hypothetical protein AAF196_19425, partial [Planctomycetota bacterium]
MELNARIYGCLALGLLAQGCGSSGGSAPAPGSVSPLSVPSQMTIVDAQDGDEGVATLQSGELVARALAVGFAAPVVGDYVTDETRLWVQDESMEPLEIINEILCYVSQCGYDDASLVNAGPFRVLIDSEGCRRGDREVAVGDGQGAQQGAGTDQVEYQEWVVDSRRADENSPQVVSIWFEEEEEVDGVVRTQEFYVRLTISSSPTRTSPYGAFELNFKALPSGASLDAEPLFEGRLATVPRQDGRAEYVFTNENGDMDGPLS